MNENVFCIISMETVLIFFIFSLFLVRRAYPLNTSSIKIGLSKELQSVIPFKFVAAIVDKSNADVVATGAVVSPFWVLTSAHLLPDDEAGLNPDNWFILAGRPFRRYQVLHVLTHPSYTWKLRTAEDLALFRTKKEISTKPAFIMNGRFPWNAITCYVISWKETLFNEIKPSSIHIFKHKIRVIQSCFADQKKIPEGLLSYYINDILCGTNRREPGCDGKTGGILYCQHVVVGLLIRQTWCQKHSANFTDIGTFYNWLSSRIEDGYFVRLTYNTGPALKGHPLFLTLLCIIVLVSILLLPTNDCNKTM